MWGQRNPAELVAVPQALYGCEAIVLDCAPHVTSLESPAWASETGSVKWAIVELVFLLCWEGIWSHTCISPRVWYWWLQHCWGLGMACGCILNLFAGICKTRLHTYPAPSATQTRLQQWLSLQQWYRRRGGLFWNFNIKIIRLLLEIPVLLALVVTGAAVGLGWKGHRKASKWN